MTPDEKRAFANEAERVFEEPIVQHVMQEFMDNVGVPMDGLPKYGIHKVVLYAAQAARAHALGISLNDLRVSTAEYGEFADEVREAMQQAGVPVVSIVAHPDKGTQ